MAKVRSRGNASTELKVVRILKAGKVKGWRRHLPIFGSPDFAFPKLRIALFIDGCFWHGCPRCYAAPKSSVGFWRQKLRKNRKRDLDVAKQLSKHGWKVLRVWECQLKSPARFLRRLCRAFKQDAIHGYLAARSAR
jgi:DNA mismatch endonuclease (patch repair protein)